MFRFPLEVSQPLLHKHQCPINIVWGPRAGFIYIYIYIYIYNRLDTQAGESKMLGSLGPSLGSLCPSVGSPLAALAPWPHLWLLWVGLLDFAENWTTLSEEMGLMSAPCGQNTGVPNPCGCYPLDLNHRAKLAQGLMLATSLHSR